MESCHSNTSQAWQPAFFSNDQATVIAELAETILPKTKIPGAKNLKLDRFIDQIIKQVLSEEDQQLFLKGMDAFEAEANELNGKSFIDSSPEQRAKILTKLEQETRKRYHLYGIHTQHTLPLCLFIEKQKELTLLGYFTSKEIGKEVLVYDPVPGHYLSDIPVFTGWKNFF